MADNGMEKSLEFEESIKAFSDSEKFLAREIRKVQIECALRKTCYSSPSPQFTRKQIAAGAGGVGVISVIITALVEIISRLITTPPS